MDTEGEGPDELVMGSWSDLQALLGLGNISSRDVLSTDGLGHEVMYMGGERISWFDEMSS